MTMGCRVMGEPSRKLMWTLYPLGGAANSLDEQIVIVKMELAPS